MYRNEESNKTQFDANLSLNNGCAIYLYSLPEAQELLTALHLYLIIALILQLGQKPHELFNITACLFERDPSSLSSKLLDISDVTWPCMFQQISPDD
jgi:hypothetical protein